MITYRCFDRSVVSGGGEFFTVLNEGSDEELIELFAGADTHPDHQYIVSSIKQEPVWDGSRAVAEEAALEFYKRMRPGDPLTMSNAKEFLISQIFDPRRYDLERVGAISSISAWAWGYRRAIAR